MSACLHESICPCCTVNCIAINLCTVNCLSSILITSGSSDGALQKQSTQLVRSTQLMCVRSSLKSERKRDSLLKQNPAFKGRQS